MYREPITTERYVPGHYAVVHVFEDERFWRIEVSGATYYIRDVLKMLGFKWDPRRKVWWCDDCAINKLFEELARMGAIRKIGRGGIPGEVDIFEAALQENYTFLIPIRRGRPSPRPR